MALTSVKPEAQIIRVPPRWLPDQLSDFTIQHYIDVLFFPRGINLIQSFTNSIFVAAIGTLLVVVVDVLAGYAFARLHFPLRGPAFALVLGSMMIPHIVNIIPLYVFFKQLGWINTFFPLIVPPIFTGSFGAFLMRQYFMTIPEELEEAARIDGAGTLTIFTRIMLPLAKPALAALAIFTFMGTWNDFFNPLLFINSKSKMTITLGIAALRGEYASEWTVMMAAATASVIPILAVYVVAQKHFIQGITLTGLKT
jgi:multiple sugar transport system permease protein